MPEQQGLIAEEEEGGIGSVDIPASSDTMQSSGLPEEVIARLELEAKAKLAIAEIDYEIAKANPETLMKFVKAMINYGGRTIVVLPRSELQKLFDKDIFIVRGEW